MSPVKTSFVQVVADILNRYLRQNDQPQVARAELLGLGERLWLQIEFRGLPPPLARAEPGVPGELNPAEIAGIMDRLFDAAAARSLLETPLKQLVKACFYPPFRKCRESYRERDADGKCRRQQRGLVRTRVSGSHCVDCPYWTALTPTQHAARLREGWAGDEDDLLVNVAMFLPEDFRLLRKLLAEAALPQSIKS